MVTPEPSLEGHTGVNQAAPLGEGVSEREQSWTQDPELRPKTRPSAGSWYSRKSQVHSGQGLASLWASLSQRRAGGRWDPKIPCPPHWGVAVGPPLGTGWAPGEWLGGPGRPGAALKPRSSGLFSFFSPWPGLRGLCGLLGPRYSERHLLEQARVILPCLRLATVENNMAAPPKAQRRVATCPSNPTPRDTPKRIDH